MRVWIRTPFSLEKNLGKAYNEEMEMCPDGDACCFIDGDLNFLTPDFGHILNEYANNNPQAILTCWTNRIHQLSVGQLHPNMQSTVMSECMRFAMSIKEDRTVSEIKGPVSGFLMVIPKSIWLKCRFTEEKVHNQPGDSKILGIDNHFTNSARKIGIPVLRMNGLFCYHGYRLLNGISYKTHLL